jgi:hypothetical protein
MKRIAVLILSVVLSLGCAALGLTGPAATSTPAPTPTTGQVKGVLVNESTGQGITARVNLVPVEVGDDGSITFSPELLKERSMSLDAADGVFLFDDVEPGHYLITANIGGGLPLDITDDQGTQVVIQVEAGQVVDLGEVSVER